MGDRKHVVYMLECNDQTLYTGYTNNLKRRVQMHERGQGAKYTRGRGPFTVVYTEGHPSKSDALRREYAIKQLTRSEKKALIATYTKEG